ncbi:DUF1629 domain-containing protein [Porphyrobacter sp. YT40]|uniref:imm11 family protein n=1 Tax=Porphyrobacter sp. YT40 TaxID=2547601 RepID=UPI00114410A5|nr:DUF1629 domain-containing protein [Porphyrobacter sp. YT40]QDH33189.1 DUF1629 domain-containing protein [Porphyrobacter sp. YT40]
MVWSFSYDPLGSSYPLAEIVEGPVDALELVDPTPDGGVGLRGSVMFSGRPVKPETVPRVIQWKSRQKIGDYVGAWVATVSDRLRALIEDIEPGVHQFEPVEFIAKDGSHLEDRWFWQICNRIDSVNREETDWILFRGVLWAPDRTKLKPAAEKIGLVFDTKAIGAACFWHDKHDSNSNYCSDSTHERLIEAGMTGFRFYHKKQV